MIVKKRGTIVSRTIHGALFLIDIADRYSNDSCTIYEINETGMFIWNNMNGSRTNKDLAVMLQSEIVDEVDLQIIVEDVNCFVEGLIARNFVEVITYG